MIRKIIIVSIASVVTLVATAMSSDRVSPDVVKKGQPGTRCTRLKFQEKDEKLDEFSKHVAERCSRFAKGGPAGEFLPNQPPTIHLATTLGGALLTYDGRLSMNAGDGVPITAFATDPEGDRVLYTYSTTGGRVTGDGPNVVWNLNGAVQGMYTITASVDDGCGCIAFDSASIQVR